MIGITEGRARLTRSRSALFTCALALACVLGALSASGASALGEQCSGSKVKGMGSFLQTRAQGQWSGSELGFNTSANPLACSGSQGAKGTPQVSYVPLASSAALRHWEPKTGACTSRASAFSPIS
jgi:hypothetical protein